MNTNDVLTKLIAEIERRIEETKSMKPTFDQFWAGQISAFKGALKIVNSLQQEQPSLPSGLDDAAEKYSENILANNEDLQDAIEDAFKAGAEWMAGQYEQIEGDLVDWYSTSDGKDYCCGVKTIDAFEVPEGFYIRKKQ